MSDRIPADRAGEGDSAGSIFEYDNSRYPVAFFEAYEAIACLSSTENAETLLVRDRKSGTHMLAKCYWGDSRKYGNTETALLKKLSHPGIPRFLAAYENETMLCAVRDYIEGLPLNQYVTDLHPSAEQSVNIVSQLCDILAYLHRLNPPVIHRDIKPQNIIIDAESNVWLIDFGISREYNAASAKDTEYLGTVDFAPPEQYGFSQTDQRTDIFSLGVLIGWLFTGETQARKALPKLPSPRLQKIVKTCTQLTPEHRYSSAELVKKALLRADGRRQRRFWRVAGAVLASLALFELGFAAGRYTDLPFLPLAQNSVVFQEPLIEQAVRARLNLSKHAPITQQDLLSVTEIYIFGETIAPDQAAYSAAQQNMAFSGGTLANGSIHTLDDLKQLKRLKILHIALQNIEDVSPLSTLEDLEIIDLNHNPISDVSPLADLYSLRELSLFESRVSDLSALAACPLLVNLDLGKTRVSSTDAFRALIGLRRLTLAQTTLASLDGIESIPGLEQLSLGAVQDRNLTPLLSLPLLKEVTLREDLRADAARDLSDAAYQLSFS